MRVFKSALALLLCLLFLLPGTALAEEESGVLNGEEMQSLLEGYIADHRINPDKLSIGYVYTETGESWFYHPDTWFYSASMYKVPLMMILAEKEYKGEITRDTKLKGLTLGDAETMILTYSNNDYAHLMMSVCADTEPNCRELYKNYVDLPEDYYDPDFHDYSYFTANFMTQVMTTLYNDPARFPNIIDCLKLAQPGQYFRIYLDGYEIAQKYGSFRDYSNRDFNHTSGIIYLPHPIILTVMTQDAPSPELTIADLAKLFADYTLQTVDPRYAEYESRQETLRLAAEAEAQRAEEKRLAEEAAAQAAAMPEPTPAPTVEPTPAEQPIVQTPAPTGAHFVASGETALRLYVLIGAAVLVLLLALVLRSRRGRRRHED